MLLALRDVTERSLLGRYLEAQGWTVRLAEVERVVRQWHDGLRAPFVVLKLEDDDPDAFAVFGALAARTLTARVIVTITPALAEELSFAEARLLGIERLVVGAKFADLASALDELRWLR